MKKIKLTQGKYALVDDADFAELNKVKWCAFKCGRTFYAMRGTPRGLGRTTQMMHIVILGKRKGLETDHIDRNGLNNQRSNLRFVTHQENCLNKNKYRGSSSKYKGVAWNKKNKKWTAQIKINGRQRHLGSFSNELDASEAWQKANKNRLR